MAGHAVELPRGVTANVGVSGVDRIDFSVGSRRLTSKTAFARMLWRRDVLQLLETCSAVYCEYLEEEDVSACA
jgi:hypothetical protein